VTEGRAGVGWRGGGGTSGGVEEFTRRPEDDRLGEGRRGGSTIVVCRQSVTE
jgi:hypothetical protein